jgi:hypothetical protein
VRATLHEGGGAEEAGRAAECFEQAAAHMEHHGALLQGLGRIARLRRGLFVLEAYPERTGTASELAAELRFLRGLVERTLGPVGWQVLARRDPGDEAPPAERARGIIAAVRFNYW